MNSVQTKKISMKFYLNIFFIISASALTRLLSLRGLKSFISIGVLCSLAVLCVLTFKYKFIENTFFKLNKLQIFISVIFTFVAGFIYIDQFIHSDYTVKAIDLIPYNIQPYLMNLLKYGIGIISLFAIFIFFYWFFNKITLIGSFILSKSDRIDKYYLIIIMFIMAVAVIILFNSTNVFYGAEHEGKIIDYDVIYTTDSGNQVSTDVYMQINARENDIRQPLFGLFSMPFAVFAKILSKAFFFIPNSYPIMINLVQIFLLNIALLLISKMLNLQSKDKVLFLLFINCSFPFILFSLVMEQYIFAFFWLILFIYTVTIKHENQDIWFIAASGSLMTSGILFTLLSKSKSIKGKIMDIFSAGLKFISIIIIFGQLPLIAVSIDMIKFLTKFVGIKITFYDKILQYLNFIASCFIKPNAAAAMITNDTVTYQYMTYQLLPAVSVNILGIIILSLAVLGFVLNYKDKFALISFVWLIFSFLLLCVLGWGTSENGLILYSLYFSWSIASLIILALKKLLKTQSTVKYVIWEAIILLFLFMNLSGIFEIIKFGIIYYPI